MNVKYTVLQLTSPNQKGTLISLKTWPTDRGMTNTTSIKAACCALNRTLRDKYVADRVPKVNVSNKRIDNQGRVIM